MTYQEAQRDGPRLCKTHPRLLWRKAQAGRRFKRKHFFTLESEKNYVAGLCTGHACILTGISTELVHSQSRRRPVTDARHIAMTVAYELSGLSTIALGKLFHRGHDMILWAQKRVNSDKALRAQADRVVAAVRSQFKQDRYA